MNGRVFVRCDHPDLKTYIQKIAASIDTPQHSPNTEWKNPQKKQRKLHKDEAPKSDAGLLSEVGVKPMGSSNKKGSSFARALKRHYI